MNSLVSETTVTKINKIINKTWLNRNTVLLYVLKHVLKLQKRNVMLLCDYNFITQNGNQVKIIQKKKVFISVFVSFILLV